MADPVNHPPHYQNIPGVECIDVVEHMPFNRGNAVKYIWRAGAKGGPQQEIEDLQKARWYIDREIELLSKRPAEVQVPRYPEVEWSKTVHTSKGEFKKA